MQALAIPYYRARLRQWITWAPIAEEPDDRVHPLVWYAVAAIVLFALGVTILLGAIVYCSLKGMYFGAYYWQNPWVVKVGCWKP